MRCVGAHEYVCRGQPRTVSDGTLSHQEYGASLDVSRHFEAFPIELPGTVDDETAESKHQRCAAGLEKRLQCRIERNRQPILAVETGETNDRCRLRIIWLDLAK